MTHLRKIMLEELHRRNYAQTTIDCYVRTVEHFSEVFPPGHETFRSGQSVDSSCCSTLRRVSPLMLPLRYIVSKSKLY